MTTTKPQKLPWSSDTNFAAGANPWSGTPTKVVPSTGIAALGFVPGQQMGAQHLNWLIANLSDWAAYHEGARAEVQAENWPERSTASGAGSATNADLSLAYLPGASGTSSRILALTTGTHLYSSEDGTSWTDRGALGNAGFTVPCVAIGRINFGATGAIVTGNGAGASLYTTTDGSTWTLRSVTIPGDGQAAYAPTLGVWAIAGNSGAVSISDSGLTWSTAAAVGGSVPAGWVSNSGGCRRLVWNGSLFVALPRSSYNKVLTSSDAINWTERTVSASLPWAGVAWTATPYGPLSAGSWMAVSAGGVVNTSLDGLTWNAVATSTLLTANDLSVNGDTWLAVTASASGGGVRWSRDFGATWNDVPVGVHTVATAGWKRVIYGGKRFITAHDTGANLDFAFSQRAA